MPEIADPSCEAVQASMPTAKPFSAQEQLSKIAARASRLEERFGPHYQASDEDASDLKTLLADRMERWERVLRHERETKLHAALAKRLSWDGLSLEQMADALGPVELSSWEARPAWLEFLAEVMASCNDVSNFGARAEQAFTPDGNSETDTPFFQLWWPFVVVARRRLVAAAGHTLRWLTPEAAANLAADLGRQLSALGALAALESFSAFRARHLPVSEPTAPAEISTELYQRFVAVTLQDGLSEFFAEYSALARQICLRAEQWVVNTARLLGRLETDQEEIQTHFSGRPLGCIQSVRTNLSDRHHGGQRVTALTFQSGLKLIYKPKNLNQEAAFQNLLAWLADKVGPDRQRDEVMLPPAIRVLPRKGCYGWVQYVETSDCEDIEAVRHYYRRAGGLLCLLHALGGNDCHRDNVFATREGPILVDVESLLQPTWDPTAAETGATSATPTSVLQTGLLPLWKRGSDGEFADFGGLSGHGNRRTRLRRKVWRAINSDGMHLGEEPVFTITTANLPTLHGQVQLPQDHSGPILDGFERCYRFLLRRREAILAVDGPLSALVGADSRLICRPSNLYAKLLRGLAENTCYARDGFERSIAIEALSRPLLAVPRKPPLWSLLSAERRSVEEGDVPFFTVAQVAAALGIEPGHFAPDFAACLHGLCEEELTRQTEIIRASLLRSAESELFQPLTRAVAALPADFQSLTDGQLLAEARRLASEIAARAQVDAQGAGWLSPEALRPGTEGARGGPLYLYGGSPGVALFLAALDRVTGEQKHRGLIEAACRPIRTYLESPTFSQWVGREPLGAGLGLGGVVYTLTRIGELLGEDAYIETASQTARWILPDRILADTAYDVLSGSAGALLGLLTLHQVTGEDLALKLAVECGRHLCANAHRPPGGGPGCAWPTGRRGELLAGFAHGAAGIGYALARLHAATGGDDPAFLQTAQNAAFYEGTLFSEKAGNWPVVMDSPDQAREPLFLSTWCHGAPGIGLSRIGGLAAVDSALIRRDVALALKNVVESGLSNIDHLCCGNLGRIEVAWTAAQTLQRPELGVLARAAASYVVGQATQNAGNYRLRVDEVENQFFEAGFFRGVSGIGYTLLRLLRPELPCVLLFA